MATDYEVTDKLRLLNAQKSQLESQLTELDDLYNRLDATSEQAKNEEEYNSIFQQKLAISEKITNIQKNVDAISNQIADLNNQANNQTAPATSNEKANASSNTSADIVAQDTTGSSSSLLSDDEQKNAAASLYPLDSGSTTVSSSTPTASTEDAALTTATSEKTIEAGQKEKVNPIPNPLHAYPNYTYGISLHALTAEDFNSLSTGGPKNFKISKTLISSASRYHSTRLPSFYDDFYFENLKLETIIGMNSHAQGTNAIQMSFTLIEPYGLTLLNRLIDVNVTELGATSYIEIPYLLEINFFGYDDNGKMVDLKDHTKYIPIKLTDMKIKASIKGGEYEITAIPFGHTSYLETTCASPANFEVTAKTVQDFFSSQGLTAEAQKQINDTVPKKVSSGSDATNTGNSDVRQSDTANKENSENGVASPPPAVKITSYVAAFNAWQAQAAKNGVQQYADEIRVEFDEKMKTNIVNPKKNPSDKAPIKGGQISASKKQASSTPDIQSKTPVATVDFEKSTFNINAGTSILALINQVLLNSEYITSQIKDPTVQQDVQNSTSSVDAENIAAKLKKETFKWYKVIPQVILGKYDKIRNQYQRTITYHVKTFEYHNSKDSRAVQSFPDGYAKKYDYMFTGQNNDIIDFEIDFNSLYYTAAQSDLAKNQQNSKQQVNETSNSSKSTVDINSSSGVTSVKMLAVSDTQGSSSLGAGTDTTKKQARIVSESLLSGAKGDMLNLKLKIIGDPHFIKQDDVFTNPGQPDYDDKKTLSPTTNSLIMDSGELYCYVTFKTPVDIDESTGLLRKDSKYLDSVFSGYFRVLTVESEFQNGKFTQNIDLIRQFNQPDDNKSSKSSETGSAAASDNRNSDKKLSEGNKTGDPKIDTPQPDSGNPSVNNSSIPDKLKSTSGPATVQQRSSTSVATTSGGGATITKADGTVTKLPDNPNEAQRANTQAITELNDTTSRDQSLADVVSSDFVVSI